MTEAAILVPGIMGSVLQDGDKVIWPGSPLELVFPYKHMTELLSPDLRATDIIRSVSISRQYADLVDSLTKCGFRENATPSTLKVFPYDWRRDNSIAAGALADCIDQMATQLGDCAINLVAHSMGGLVSRCYLESGCYSSRPGFAMVKRLITLGTPHRGSPMALAAALGQEKRLFLNREQVKTVASDVRYPSVYQLLPPRGEPYAWDRAHEARFEPVDVYSQDVAGRLGLVSQNLTAASTFHAMLDLNRRPSHVKYFCFVGTRQNTTTSFQVTLPNSGNAQAMKIDNDDAGDGTVPIWSAALPSTQMAPVGGEHAELYKNGGLRRILGALLGKPGVLLAAGPVPEISVRHKVVNPESTTQVVIDFPQHTERVDAVLELRRRVDAEGVPQPLGPPIATYPIQYSGLQIDHLAVLLVSPQYRGVYEISYEDRKSSISCTTELFVQGT